MTETYIINSCKEMEALGARLAKSLRGGDILLLTGELGAGKTVFCKGVAVGLGVTASVVSPTFTLMNEYFGTEIEFCHFDAYRLADEEEAYGAGLADYFGNENCICAVEWWENICGMFDGLDATEIVIEKIDASSRKVTVKK